MYDRALGAYSHALRPDHKDILKTQHAYGAVLFNLGQLDEAKEVYTQVLAGREKVRERLCFVSHIVLRTDILFLLSIPYI